MNYWITGKLARLTRLPNTKNGNPMYGADIVTLAGALVHVKTKPNDMFSYRLGSLVGALAQWKISDYRGQPRVVNCSFDHIRG